MNLYEQHNEMMAFFMKSECRSWSPGTLYSITAQLHTFLILLTKCGEFLCHEPRLVTPLQLFPPVFVVSPTSLPLSHSTGPRIISFPSHNSPSGVLVLHACQVTKWRHRSSWVYENTENVPFACRVRLIPVAVRSSADLTRILILYFSMFFSCRHNKSCHYKVVCMHN
jgi:hypothetical protein